MLFAKAVPSCLTKLLYQAALPSCIALTSATKLLNQAEIEKS